MTKYISCCFCENRKGPLFAIPNPTTAATRFPIILNGEKQYICKRCMERLKEKEAAKKSTPIVKQ